MSTQKSKKGFTLIELMVVIVIIGILAAIAIPKLFGMSAKAKAQEVGPAMGTWAKMQQAYQMETGYWGGAKKISYKMPGDQPEGPISETSNFKYTIVPSNTNADKESTASLEAENLFATDDCKKGDAKWKGEFADLNATDPVTNITGASATDCEALTPNFKKIGVAPTSTPQP